MSERPYEKHSTIVVWDYFDRLTDRLKSVEREIERLNEERNKLTSQIGDFRSELVIRGEI